MIHISEATPTDMFTLSQDCNTYEDNCGTSAELCSFCKKHYVSAQKSAEMPELVEHLRNSAGSCHGSSEMLKAPKASNERNERNRTKLNETHEMHEISPASPRAIVPQSLPSNLPKSSLQPAYL